MAKSVLLISPLEDFLMNPREFPPLGVLYLSSYLKKHGINVDVLHGNPEDIKREYDYYGISSSTPQYPKSKLFLEHIKSVSPVAKVILGGAHTVAPKCAKEAVKDGFDYVVMGPGESALVNIINGSESNGIILGKSISQDELDESVPDRDAIDIRAYQYPLSDKKASTIITSRGCPFYCGFCSISNGSVKFRSPERVIEEIGAIRDKYGFDGLLILDDSFVLRKDRLKKILHGIKDLHISYRCYARTDTSNDPELLELMLNSGCIELGVGIESGSQKILDLVGKRNTVRNHIDFLKLAKQVGLPTNVFIMTGLPGESRKTIESTRKLVEQTKPEKFGYNIFTPLPDTPIVVDYETPFSTGPYKGKCYRDFITIYPMPYEHAVMKAKKIDQCFISTPGLTREEIVEAYHSEFEKFVQITGFDPRKRGGRDLVAKKI